MKFPLQILSKYFFGKTGEISLALLLSVLVLVNTLFIDRKNAHLISSPKPASLPEWVNWEPGTIMEKFSSTHLVFEYKNYEHFRRTTIQKWDTPIYISLDGTVLPFSPYGDVCSWIRKNTEVSAAFIQPAYVHEFRGCAMRQGFLSVQQDGILAAFSRKFATLYLERFKAIHEGVTEDNLPGLSKDKWGSTYSQLGKGDGEPKALAYEILRQKYLSIDDSKLEKLKKLYPGYGYFLTELSHRLPYPIAYQNDHFTLYKISEESSD